MRYLLDVNALLALGLTHHEFHVRVADWLLAEDFPPLATCSITELGFVRVLSQAAAYGLTVAQAKALLVRLKKSPRLSCTFLSDHNDISHLPLWAKNPRQITDAHLVQLALSHGVTLATLDHKIPGAFLIPQPRS